MRYKWTTLLQCKRSSQRPRTNGQRKGPKVVKDQPPRETPKVVKDQPPRASSSQSGNREAPKVSKDRTNPQQSDQSGRAKLQPQASSHQENFPWLRWLQSRRRHVALKQGRRMISALHSTAGASTNGAQNTRSMPAAIAERGEVCRPGLRAHSQGQASLAATPGHILAWVHLPGERARCRPRLTLPTCTPTRPLPSTVI